MVSGSWKNEHGRRIVAGGIGPLEHEELLAVSSGQVAANNTKTMQKWSTYHFEEDCILQSVHLNSVTVQVE